jgi:hypothetical protein
MEKPGKLKATRLGNLRRVGGVAEVTLAFLGKIRGPPLTAFDAQQTLRALSAQGILRGSPTG